MSYFVVLKTSNDQFRFRFHGTNHEQILASETYTTKQGCINGIDSVKRLAPYDGNYRRTGYAAGTYRFTIVAGNGETVAHSSESYSTAYNRDHAIEVVKRDAPSALVYDRTT